MSRVGMVRIWSNMQEQGARRLQLCPLSDWTLFLHRPPHGMHSIKMTVPTLSSLPAPTRACHYNWRQPGPECMVLLPDHGRPPVLAHPPCAYAHVGLHTVRLCKLRCTLKLLLLQLCRCCGGRLYHLSHKGRTSTLQVPFHTCNSDAPAIPS